MGNRYKARGVAEELYMTNAGTSVFLDVLTLAGSALSETPWQQHLTVAFSDSERMGRGISGFDLADLPWTGDDGQHDFLLRVIDLALTRHGWDRLHYDPPLVADRLATFRRLVTAFAPVPNPDSMGPPIPCMPRSDWTLPPPPYQLQRCLRHSTFHGEWMCRLCDWYHQPLDAPKVWDLVCERTADGRIMWRVIAPLREEAIFLLRPLLDTALSRPNRCAPLPPELIDRIAVIHHVELDSATECLIKLSIA